MMTYIYTENKMHISKINLMLKRGGIQFCNTIGYAFGKKALSVRKGKNIQNLNEFFPMIGRYIRAQLKRNIHQFKAAALDTCISENIKTHSHRMKNLLK